MAKDKKTSAASAAAVRPDTGSSNTGPNPVWFKPVMFGFMLLGLVWIIVYYLSASTYPVPSLHAWNILVGFGIMFVGFLMTTRWR
ncbi:septation inhibitor protein [Frondihabitans sp. PAMC 28766]|uniref:cell division protein CrgA n=1 Tax=Frondihabitans sp. PAMC 28766 TaxID=1795630 RepID=UPI00078C9DF4|nr:septation inhibitor protein [Frondihabitans sp. PAMC 28766]